MSMFITFSCIVKKTNSLYFSFLFILSQFTDRGHLVDLQSLSEIGVSVKVMSAKLANQVRKSAVSFTLNFSLHSLLFFPIIFLEIAGNIHIGTRSDMSNLSVI